ncbi:MAG TPA: peptidoglycan DD-metalloendopeptidase family protein [Fibrobacteria bacterium]|jgi:murein DD-endopeptidase MepM/ murein hydrolase activator NlpD|nr:peptidoglycan DD-metalloendopeptidase family protein [Fibrobacteria bacterium]
MDRKIRIFFFPRDASRVRAIVVSRKLALAALFTVAPLCLLGFWLALSGVLRESPERRAERDRLESETSALSGKTSRLQDEVERLRGNLDTLEALRVRVAISSGIEGPRGATQSAPERFSGLSAKVPRAGDIAAPLSKVRGIGRFLDSTLFVLTRDADRAARLPTANPAPGALVTRAFGASRDPFTGRTSLHPGVDFGLAPGAPVLAAGGGTVIAAGSDPVWGIYVRIRHDGRAETFYAHLKSANVTTGRVVARGQVIGWAGSSGASSGPHLHFELRLSGDHVDPMPYLLGDDRSI